MVPKIFTPLLDSFVVRLFATWPPTDVTTPFELSNSVMSRILSSVTPQNKVAYKYHNP